MRAQSACRGAADLWLVCVSGAKLLHARRELVILFAAHSPQSASRFRSAAACAAAVALISEMFYDLNVPWTDATRELQRTVAFLDECEKILPCLVEGLTQCSRIRRCCPHAYLCRETACRFGTSKKILWFSKTESGGAPRAAFTGTEQLLIAAPIDVTRSYRTSLPCPGTPTDTAAMQHLLDRLGLQLPYSTAAAALRPRCCASHR